MFKRSKDHETIDEKITNLYGKYSKLMRQEAYNILRDYALAEDAVQQAFMKLMNNMEKISHGNDAKTRNFLVIICRNVAFDIYKSRTYLNEKSEAIDFEIEDEDNISDYMEPSKVLIDRENIKRLSEVIESLPPIYRDVLLLESVHNNTKEEIADLLNINYETVRKRSYRAKKMLVEALEKEDLK